MGTYADNGDDDSDFDPSFEGLYSTRGQKMMPAKKGRRTRKNRCADTKRRGCAEARLVAEQFLEGKSLIGDVLAAAPGTSMTKKATRVLIERIARTMPCQPQDLFTVCMVTTTGGQTEPFEDKIKSAVSQITDRRLLKVFHNNKTFGALSAESVVKMVVDAIQQHLSDQSMEEWIAAGMHALNHEHNHRGKVGDRLKTEVFPNVDLTKLLRDCLAQSL